jgi:hypothetical protein
VVNIYAGKELFLISISKQIHSKEKLLAPSSSPKTRQISGGRGACGSGNDENEMVITQLESHSPLLLRRKIYFDCLAQQRR